VCAIDPLILLTFRDIERGSIKKAGNRLIKFEGCCKQAKKDGLKYIWMDTCCIDKTNSVELGSPAFLISSIIASLSSLTDVDPASPWRRRSFISCRSLKPASHPSVHLGHGKPLYSGSFSQNSVAFSRSRAPVVEPELGWRSYLIYHSIRAASRVLHWGLRPFWTLAQRCQQCTALHCSAV
jgi:hypothetical protein